MTKIMTQIIRTLLVYIKFQENIIISLFVLLTGRNVFPKSDVPISKKYRKLQIDSLPIIEALKKFDYQDLLDDYYQEKGRELKPINRRSSSSPPKSLTCPRCSAPGEYLYDNTGGRGQYHCKVCKLLFNSKSRSTQKKLNYFLIKIRLNPESPGLHPDWPPPG